MATTRTKKTDSTNDTNTTTNATDYAGLGSKAEAIRKAHVDHPDWTQKRIAIELTKVGVDVTAGRVSAVLRGPSNDSGKVDVEKNGNFQTDITIKPSPAAPRELTDMLRGMARPSSDGSFRIRRNGNVNRLAG